MSFKKNNGKHSTPKIPFERKYEPVLPIEAFYRRQILFVLYAAILISISLAIGMIGYHSLANLDWTEAFHNAAMILAGMGEIDAMPDNTARIFSGFYALFSGVVFLSTVAVMFSPLVHRILHIMHLENTREE